MKNREAMLRLSRMRAMILPLCCVFFLFACNDNFGTALQDVSGNGNGPVPGNGGIVSASYLSSTLLDVRWQKGNDSATNAARLQYRVFACVSQTASYDESLSTGTELTPGWSVDIDEVKAYVSGNPSWCNVYVRDEDGKITAYLGVIPAGYENIPPSPGGNGLISLSFSSSRVTASWVNGTDAETGQSSLVYRVFYSLTDNISTFQNASLNGTEITAGWTRDLSSVTTAELSLQTAYWFNLFVMDGDGRISSYTSAGIVTGSAAAPVPGSILSCTLSRTSALFSWSTAVGAGTLSYRVYRTDGTSSVNTLTSYESAVSTGAELTGGWTQDLTSVRADGLSPGSVYYAVVFVKDSSGMISAYDPFSVNLPYDTAPLVGNSGVSTSSVTGKNITVSWEKASDDYTQNELLLYRVYMSTAEGDLSGSALPAESSAVTEITKGWTDDISSAAVALPLRSTTYYFNVYVCDRSGNFSSYAASSGFALGLSQPPSAGGSGALTVLSGTTSSLMLCWTKGSDDETPVSQLQYRVYRFSSNPSIVSASQLPSDFSSEITSGWTADISSVSIAAANTVSLYYYNVYVRDGDGQIQSYASVKGSVVSASVQPGGNGVITAAASSAKKVDLSWAAAVSASDSSVSGLRYAVYSSLLQSDVLTYSAAASDATCEMAFVSCTGDPITFEAKMSVKGETYWFNVFVMDANNTVAAYTPVSAVTGE